MGVFILSKDTSSDFNQYLKIVKATKPNKVEGLNNTSYFYYFNKLLKMTYAIFKFDNIPETWNMPYFKRHLFLDGVIAVTDTKDYGVIPLRTGTSGINVYDQPTNFIIANSILGNIEGKIGVDGELIYLSQIDSFFYSVEPLITRYATLLAEVDGSLSTTLINSRVAHVFYAKSQAQLKTMQKMYDKITTGEPAVFIRDTIDDGQNVLFNNVKNSFIGKELLDVKRSLMNEFMSEIGINNANTQKKERMLDAEVNSNRDELSANIYEWYTNLSTCIDKVNKLYDLNLKVSINEEVLTTLQSEGGVEDEL